MEKAAAFDEGLTGLKPLRECGTVPSTPMEVIVLCAYFPSFEQDETIYSICARIHVLNGGISGLRTLDAQLLVPAASRRLAIPVSLKVLEHATLGRIRCSVDTLLTRTPLGPWLPFIQGTVSVPYLKLHQAPIAALAFPDSAPIQARAVKDF